MDIDIDLPTTFDPKAVFKNVVVASMVKNGKLVKHPCGTYFQNIATDPITGLSAITHKDAQDLGYTKIDMLHLGLLDTIGSKSNVRKLMHSEPDWSLLNKPENVEKLFHIRNHFPLINRVKPKSVEDMADCMALIRPNKRAYLEEYLRDRETIRPRLYREDSDDKSSFRRSHAIAYSFNVVLQLHLIKQGLL